MRLEGERERARECIDVKLSDVPFLSPINKSTGSFWLRVSLVSSQLFRKRTLCNAFDGYSPVGPSVIALQVIPVELFFTKCDKGIYGRRNYVVEWNISFCSEFEYFFLFVSIFTRSSWRRLVLCS